MTEMTSVAKMHLSQAAEQKNGRQSTDLPENKTKVLIVDDEPAVGTFLREALRTRDFECESCTSAEEALQRLASPEFDVVVSDLRMPDLSGLDLLRRIRPTRPFLVFLMATGVNDVQQATEAMKEGCDDYLVKPFRVDDVAQSLRRALGKKGLERELAHHREVLEETVDQRTRQWQAAMRRVVITYDETLEALGGALDLRDDETAGHSQRVMRTSVEIACRLGCLPEQVTTIARGAFLHDIGKIGIPDAILRKPGKLNEEEMEIMRSHVRIGYELVSRVAFLSGAAEIVLTHHEHYDGTGYPQGLIGEEIPLGARIFAVADTLDAMTSDRPYRRALSYHAAREEITREAGKQFDPRVVETFQRISDQTLEEIRYGRGVRARSLEHEIALKVQTMAGLDRSSAAAALPLIGGSVRAM